MPAPALEQQVETVLASLEKLSTKATLDGMARYAIPSDNALGVAMTEVAARLSKSTEPSAQWIGKDALRELR